jgi:hypothetical protein
MGRKQIKSRVATLLLRPSPSSNVAAARADIKQHAGHLPSRAVRADQQACRAATYSVHISSAARTAASTKQVRAFSVPVSVATSELQHHLVRQMFHSGGQLLQHAPVKVVAHCLPSLQFAFARQQKHRLQRGCL